MKAIRAAERHHRQVERSRAKLQKEEARHLRQMEKLALQELKLDERAAFQRRSESRSAARNTIINAVLR